MGDTGGNDAGDRDGAAGAGGPGADTDLLQTASPDARVVGGRVIARDALRASEARQRFLLTLSDALRDQPDERAVTGRAVELIAEHLRLDRCWVSEVFGEQGYSTVGPERARPGLPPMAGVYRLADYPETIRRLATEPLVVRDAAADPGFTDPEKALLARLHLRALLVVPLRRGPDRVVWALAAAAAAPRDWTDGERLLLEEVAERVWAAAERRRAEAARRASEERLRLALLAAGMGSFAWDPVNDRGEPDGRLLDLFGLAGPGVSLADVMERVHPDDRERHLAAVARALDPAGDGHLRTEVRFGRPDGGERWLEMHGRTEFAGDPPRAVRMAGVIADVTQRHQAEAAVRASEARLRAVAANLPGAAVFVVGPDLRYSLAEGQGLRDAGFAPTDYEGKTLAEALPPEQLPDHERTYRQVLAGGTFAHEHGDYGRHFVTHGAPLRDPDGAVTAALAVSYDITDRKRAEEAVRASEERFRLLVERVRDHALFALDPDGVVASWNPAAERVFGYPAGEIVGRSGDAFFTPEDRAAGLPGRERAAAAAVGRATDENWAVRKDGSRFWASGASSAVRDAAGRLTGFVKVVRDRTEARDAGEAVRRAEERLRLALDAARMGIWEWDIPAGAHTRDANLNRLLGLPADPSTHPLAEFLGAIHPDDRGRVEAGLRAAAAEGRPLTTEFRVVWPDGAVRWLRDQGDVVRGPDGAAARMTGACVDITETKAAEAELRRARDELEQRVEERTAALAEALRTLEVEAAVRHELAGRLATAQEEERRRIARDLHDRLGQYLAALRLGLTAAGKATAADLPAHLTRLGELTADTGREVHRLALELRPTSLDDLGLATTLRQHVEGWAAHAGIPAEFAARRLDSERFTWQVSTAVYRVVQEALTNVLKHARATRVSVLVERQPDRLSAVVEDDGVGFDSDGAIGTPRAQGGLGLLGMRERVALVGGTLEIESAPGAGTSVYVRIPLLPPRGTDG